jgi:heme/copper-type cytochrome/quinol oxidase subunit 1
MPRRIPDYPDAYSGWNLVSSFGSLISVIATVLFGYIIYDIFISKLILTKNPWASLGYFKTLSFTSSTEIENDDTDVTYPNTIE